MSKGDVTEDFRVRIRALESVVQRLRICALESEVQRIRQVVQNLLDEDEAAAATAAAAAAAAPPFLQESTVVRFCIQQHKPKEESEK